MRNILIVVLTLTISLAAFLTEAKMVSYVDKKGKVRYVNTDFAKVPEEYRDQIEPEPVDLPANQEIVTPKEPPPEAVESESPLVEVLIKLDCSDCRQLEFLLNAHGIKYMRYDVDRHPRGKELYQELGGDVPITKVGDEVIYGADAPRVVAAVRLQEQNTKKTDQAADQPALPSNQ